MLELRDVAKGFEAGRPLFENVTLAIGAGEFVALVGESGSGKSTLLNLIAGLDHPDRGTLRLGDIDLATADDDAATLTRRRHIGFVFQSFHLLPYLTVERNVALPLVLNGVAEAEAKARTAEVLATVGLAARAGASPRVLSGGEMQRAAIARALVHRPRLLLADEPTGNLDADNAARVLDCLCAALASSGAAGLMVTHSALAAARANRVLRLTRTGLVADAAR
jgi:putative ABC transport system ATP-binding protein